MFGKLLLQLQTEAIFGLKMHKKRLATGLPLRPGTRGAYSAPPDPLAGFKGATLRQGNTGKGRAGKGQGEKRQDGSSSLTNNSWIRH